MIAYLFGSIIVTVLGAALVVWVAVLARNAVRHQRELARQRSEIASQNELDEFIRRIDQATTDAELNSLEEEKKRKDD